MIPALVKREFGHGSGVISPNQLMFIVDIPKNASSFVSDWTMQHGWCAAVAHNHEHRIAEMIVILRDPVERWISGIAQYINGWILHAKSFYDISVGPNEDQQYLDAGSFIAQYNAVTERLIFDNLERHDDHVWPQCEIIDGLLPNKHRSFFYIDRTWEDRLSDHLGIPKANDIDKNAGSANQDQRLLQEFFRARISARPNLRNLVQDRYREDYDLIQRVTTHA